MDALTFLHAEHTRVRALLDDLEDALHSTETNRTERLESATTLVIAESQHESIEQEIFRPAVRRALSDGGSLADKALEQEDEGKRLLQTIEDHAPGRPEFATALSAFIDAARAHIEYEEHIVWPAFRAAVGRPELDSLGEKLSKAQRRAPTRPHPHTPSESAIQASVGMAAAAVDRIRDKATGRDEMAPE